MANLKVQYWLKLSQWKSSPFFTELTAGFYSAAFCCIVEHKLVCVNVTKQLGTPVSDSELRSAKCMDSVNSGTVYHCCYHYQKILDVALWL